MAFSSKTTAPLGFGMMRLPMDGERVDLETTARMVDLFLSRGFTYFDTAYFYLDEQSEPAVRDTLVRRHARESFTLATKMPVYAVERREDLPRFFDTQLSRTEAGYFDYYLLHAVNGGNYDEKVAPLSMFDFLRERRDEGKIRHLGFSFHDTPETLARILDDPAMREVEFVQLQINYLDWNSPGVRARECYETARDRGKNVVIMEPVRGGSLATLPQALRGSLPGSRSPAGEALAFAASLEGVIAVLSGMSNLSQMEENTALLSSLSPLPASEREALLALAESIRAIPTIPCTRCKYCLPVCPQKIPIPRVISAVNDHRVYGKNAYERTVGGGPRASDCLSCGACARACPQKIDIPAAMREAREIWEK